MFGLKEYNDEMKLELSVLKQLYQLSSMVVVA